jgi:hypothetical protein
VQVAEKGLRRNYVVRVLIPCYKESLAIIQRTVLAAKRADRPAGTRVVIYVCDDGNDPKKKAWVKQMDSPEVLYVTGRDKSLRSLNGKSANLNYCLQLIYPDIADPEDPEGLMKIPVNELMCLFDADQTCSKGFFQVWRPNVLLSSWNRFAKRRAQLAHDFAACNTAHVHRFWASQHSPSPQRLTAVWLVQVLLQFIDSGDDVGVALSPQLMYNVIPDCDIFNHQNVHFWEMMQPGMDALGFISLTGTNMILRCRALHEAGWFPMNSVTEDWALGMRFKKLGYRCRYVNVCPASDLHHALLHPSLHRSLAQNHPQPMSRAICHLAKCQALSHPSSLQYLERRTPLLLDPCPEASDPQKLHETQELTHQLRAAAIIFYRPAYSSACIQCAQLANIRHHSMLKVRS